MRQQSAFHLEEKLGKFLRLRWVGSYFAGQRAIGLSLDSERRAILLEERGLLPFQKKTTTIPFHTVLDVSMKVYRAEAEGELLPICLCVRYKEEESENQAELRGFIKGLDSLEEARDFVYRFARVTSLQEKSGDAFRSAETLELGFYTEHQQEYFELQLHRTYKEGAARVPEVTEEADYDKERGSFLLNGGYIEPPPSFWRETRNFMPGLTKDWRNAVLLWILFWPLWFAMIFFIWLAKKLSYDTKQVSRSFAAFGFFRGLFGWGLVAAIVLEFFESGAIFILVNPFTFISGGVIFVFHLLRRRQVTLCWPRASANRAQKQGRALVFTVALFSLCSLVSLLPAARFQLMVWDLSGGLRPKIIYFDSLFRTYKKLDDELALQLLIAPGVIEHQTKMTALFNYDLKYGDCTKLSILYSGLKLRGLTDEEILASEQGKKLFLGMLCTEASLSVISYLASSIDKIDWLTRALALKPSGEFRYGVIPFAAAQQGAKFLAKQILSKHERRMLLAVGLELSGLLSADDFTWLLLQYLRDAETYELQLLEKVLATRAEVITLLSDIPPGSAIGVEFSGSIDSRVRQESFYAFLRSCGYIPQPGTDLLISTSSWSVSYPYVHAEYPHEYQSPVYKYETKGYGKTRRTEKVYSHSEKRTEYRREDGPLAINTAIVRFQRGEKSVQGQVQPFGVIRKLAKGDSSATVKDEQLLLSWRYGLPK